MRLNIYEKVLEEANYLLEKKATIRQTAEHFEMSKTQLHYDMKYQLPQVNPGLAKEVEAQFEHHKQIRHIRGGFATKNRRKK